MDKKQKKRDKLTTSSETQKKQMLPQMEKKKRKEITTQPPQPHNAEPVPLPGVVAPIPDIETLDKPTKKKKVPPRMNN
jgi:hypothetical protein